MWVLYVFALFAGVTNTVMAGCNTTLGKRLHQPLIAAAVVYGAGLIATVFTALIASAFNRTALPSIGATIAVPWWGWFGGVLGAIYIVAGIVIPGKTGAGPFTGMTVTAAIITSLVMDHFALVGFEQHSANPARLTGAALMLAGLILIAKF